MAAELDDLLLEAKTPFSRRPIILLLLVALVAGGGIAARDLLFTPEASTEAPAQTVEVKRGPVINSLSLSGTVVAESTSQLNFEQSGVITKVNVQLGQQVKTGDVLAELNSVSANDAVRQAELNQQAAQIRLTELLNPPTAADKAVADQSLTQAQQTLTTATEDLRKLEKDPTASDLVSAQQAVTSAQSQLAQAQSARDKLTAPGSNDRSSQEGAMRSTQNGVTTAEAAQRTADNALTTAQGALYSAETAYCPDSSVSFCSSRAAPVSAGDEGALLSAAAGGSADKATKASGVLQANSAYKNAVNGRSSAQTSVDAARRELAAAQQKYALTPAGPSASELASADAAIVAARQGVQTAQQKLAELLTPDAGKLATARAALDSAQTGLTAAQAKRDQVYAGSKQSDIHLQRNQVALSKLARDKARSDLDKTKLIAPYDGTVAAITIHAGDLASGPGSGSGSGSSTAAITLNTPDALHLDLVVGESDYSKLKVGQHGFVSLSGLDGAGFPIEVESIGTLPCTNQGVVTYQARALLQMDAVMVAPPGLAPGGAPTQGAQQGGQGIIGGLGGGPVFIGPGGSAPGGPAPSGGAQPGGAAPSGLRAKPAPGMQGQATVIIEQKLGVLTVPVRALSHEALDSVVKVQKDDGSIETVKVKTGVRNAQVVEVTEGLKEGQKVVLPPQAAAPSGGKAGDQPGTFAVPAGGAGIGGGQPTIIQFGPGPGGP